MLVLQVVRFPKIKANQKIDNSYVGDRVLIVGDGPTRRGTTHTFRDSSYTFNGIYDEIAVPR